MRYRFGYVITATVLFSIASPLQPKNTFLEVQGAMAQTSPIQYWQPSYTICWGQEIPQGWVITAQTTNGQCGFGLSNAFNIKQPGAREVVCRYSPIPPNYVITGTTTNGYCSFGLDNAFNIERLQANPYPWFGF